MAQRSNKQNITAGLYKSFAFETITVTDTSKSLTSATYTDSDSQKAKRAIITVEDAQIRYRYDGTAPSASVGHLLNPMDVLTLVGSDNISNFQVIRKGSTNGTIQVTYEN